MRATNLFITDGDSTKMIDIITGYQAGRCCHAENQGPVSLVTIAHSRPLVFLDIVGDQVDTVRGGVKVRQEIRGGNK